jgi:hypothetical protein
MTMPSNPLPAQLASQAESIVNTLKQTDYQFTEKIDQANGVYDCDCNGFVGFVLQGASAEHYSMIPIEANQPRPRAFEYYDFFDTLTPESTGGWHRIDYLKDARRGDIIAWRFPEVVAGQNTGHVFFVGDTPKLDSGVFAVRVYDSADQPHFQDTRGAGAGQFPTGVGSGFINFQVDAEGRPIAFQFSPSAAFETFPIAIGRVEPLPASTKSD